MLSTNRKFHFVGDLNIKRSKFLKSDSLPKDDEINWMFIELDQTNRFSFVYKIEEPLIANYNIPFKIKIAITFYELIKDVLEMNKTYSVMRGEEKIGTIKLTKLLV